METVNVNAVELLTILKKNKIKHISTYKEALIDYTDAVLVVSQKNLTIAQIGKKDNFKNIKRVPSEPESHESEYSKAIRMLELSVDEDIKLSEQEFSQLVLDEWHWKRMFELSNQSYKTIKGDL